MTLTPADPRRWDFSFDVFFCFGRKTLAALDSAGDETTANTIHKGERERGIVMAFTGHHRTILGPLTTVFTPPAPCTYAVGWCSTCDVAWWGQTCAQSSVQDDTNCWPTTMDGAPEPSQAALYGRGFYSPGLECPEGYTTACTAIAGESSQWKVQFLMEA
ncbi:hypothetical protein VTG60DRAFT_3735 [Thermothelomyces hinnuleus]